MKKWLLTTALLLAAAATQAADVLNGDAAAGEQLTSVCTACHAADGNSPASAFPKLAGLGEKYLLLQMQYIRDGMRPVTEMTGQLDAMSDQQLADIAAFYASKQRTIEQADPELIALGEKVYRAGVAERGVAACIACHSAKGSGNGPAGFPGLGGQYAEYIAAQLRAYRKGYEDPTGRVTDGDTKIMRSNAFGLSDMEIEAVASYISGLN